jgi:LacI family transcriptional regulator
MGNRAAKMLIDRLESEEEHDEEENYKTEVIETHLKGNLLIRLLV